MDIIFELFDCLVRYCVLILITSIFYYLLEVVEEEGVAVMVAASRNIATVHLDRLSYGNNKHGKTTWHSLFYGMR